MPAAAQMTAPPPIDWRDRYQPIRQIGSGGFAQVFEGWDRVLEEPVALKIIADGRAVNARIRREIEAAAALEHPNIVALYDWFVDGRESVLVWELVRGRTLGELSHELGDRDVVAVGVELLEALAFAHSQGIIHRDVKPENVMLGDDGHVKVMDFGIAHLMDSDTLTGVGDVIGTIAYMSPEQAAGQRVRPPSDVYSAGMVLYELLAGAHPLRGATPAETLANVAGARLPSLATLRPDLPDELITLIDGACAPRPAERPSSGYLSDALQDLLHGDRLRGRGLRLGGLLQPLARGARPLERVAGAGLAMLVAASVTAALPAYPPSWILPLLALTAAIWAVVPRAGLAWLLGVLAFPLFNVSLSAGAVYLVLATALFLCTCGRPIVALWPALALLLTPAYLTLLAPAAAALLGRLRGLFTAAWAGVGSLLFLLLTQAPAGPFTLQQARSPLAAELAAAGDPLAFAERLLAHVATPEMLLQVCVWTGLAAAMGVALGRRRLTARLWIWSSAFAGVFAAYRIVPIAVWDRPLSLWPLIWSVAAPAAVILLPLVLATGEAPEESDDGDLQEG